MYKNGEVIKVDFDQNLTLYAVWEVQEPSTLWMWIVLGVAGAAHIVFVILLILNKKGNKKRKLMTKQ